MKLATGKAASNRSSQTTGPGIADHLNPHTRSRRPDADGNRPTPLRPNRAAICLLVLAAAPVFLSAPALADGTTAALRKAKTHYRQGSLGEAFTELEQAATLIARKLAGRYAKTFPPAPSGWRAQPVKSSIEGKRRAGRTLLLSRKYVQDGGPGMATAQFMVDNLGIIAAIKRIKPGEPRAKGATATIVPIEGAGKAVVKFDASRGAGDIYVFVTDRFYITIKAQKVENRAFLARMLSTWNFAGVKRAAGLK